MKSTSLFERRSCVDPLFAHWIQMKIEEKRKRDKRENMRSMMMTLITFLILYTKKEKVTICVKLLVLFYLYVFF